MTDLNNNNIRDIIGKKLLFADGAMGTMMQAAGLGAGEIPEYWVIEHPDKIKDIHKAYLDAGCNILSTCTFGANPIKLGNSKYSARELVYAAVSLARQSIEETGKTAFVALDAGSTGKLLEPLGDLAFEDAVSAYKEMFDAGRDIADLILIETMTDTYELKAAVLAAKEATDLSVFATVMPDENGQLLTGGDITALTALLEGLGVDALGLNCGFGPALMLPQVRSLMEKTCLPVIVTPNAGLPHEENGRTVFDLDPAGFADEMEKIADAGPFILGGCCGTTPAHMKAMTSRLKGRMPSPIVPKHTTLISSYTHAVEIGHPSTIIGEKINPTGNKALAKALRADDISAVASLAVKEKNAGAQVLDVNVGLPDIDEPTVLPGAIEKIQEITDLPLVIDCSNAEAIEKAARIYNGKPMINSVNAKQSSMDAIFPIVQKYGGTVIALTLGEDGIPKTAEGRVELAKIIIDEAAKYGIDKKDIIVDALAMTISADVSSSETTLKAVEMIRRDLGVSTVLGVSNVSFGLPAREKINTAFYAMALDRGLSAAIIDPFSDAMMDTAVAGRALTMQDPNCTEYIESFEDSKPDVKGSEDRSLEDAIIDGLRDDAAQTAKKLLKTMDPMTVINDHVIPALAAVGSTFETGESFLPQLLMSAEAAGAAFDEIKEQFPADSRQKKGRIILATVEGDIHDIGKNIVKVLLENHDYDILDLGKDVPIDEVVKAAADNNIKLIGLSALMTTTVPNMKKTIEKLKENITGCRICVGGAVLTEEYAAAIGADCYCKDAMATVRYAERFFE
ncbi:MAG: homocysteine S-methyltransferase family protein [Eubacteriaceae bacterium]|nr:homocysteine S-methyltransferase family protein [Eubacteriaceae bacterium]